MISPVGLLLASACYALTPALAFQPPSSPINASAVVPNRRAAVAVVVPPLTTMASSTTAADAASSTDEETSKSYLYVPSERDERYQGNHARYLLDLHDERATFDFCGGMMFQLVLSDKLKSHLETVVSDSNDRQPIVHPASQQLMSRVPEYRKSSHADNVSIFHGRELRKVPTANGGMGFVLQLSFADPSGVASAAADGGAPAGKGADDAWTGGVADPQGWSSEEIATYDGWRPDGLRKWRNGAAYESEGFGDFSERFGKDAFGLNHRCFLHSDGQSRMWLSAEDGCEGTPSEGKNLAQRLGGILFGK